MAVKAIPIELGREKDDDLLVDEIKTAVKFRHENIVQVYGFSKGCPPHAPEQHWLLVTQKCEFNLYVMGGIPWCRLVLSDQITDLH